mmetsp:Transcript_21834/g.53134  ORF Transcript_21834/g.53134 Transcript_21834/m.53134 type:complete len:406 (+) Transcript_21834:288-1505(+)
MQPNAKLVLAAKGRNRLPGAVELRSHPPKIRRIVIGIVLHVVLADELRSVDVVGCDANDLSSELLQGGIGFEIGLGDAVHLWSLVHADKHVGVLEPVRCLFLIGHIPHCNLRIQGVGKILFKLTLNRGLMSQHAQVMVKSLVPGDQSRVPLRVQSRPPRPAKNLQHIQDPQVVKASFLCVVDIRSLDDHRPRRQIHAPGQCRRATQNPDAAIQKSLFHHVPVLPKQPSVVHPECLHEKAVDLLVAGLLHLELALVIPLRFHGRPGEPGDLLLLLCHLDQGVRRLCCVCSGVNEHHHLVPCLNRLPNLVIAHLIESRNPLKIAVRMDTYKCPLQWNRPVLITEMKSVPLIHPQKLRHVSIVGQCGGKPQDSNIVSRRLLEPEGSGNNSLNDGPSVLVQKVHLINNQ